MAEAPRLAIDAMGGDDGLTTMLAGVAIAAASDPELALTLVGQEKFVYPALESYPALKSRVSIVDAPDIIRGEDGLKSAIRISKTSSIGMAIDLVKQGKCGAAISGGNTAALMSIAKLMLKTMPGIDRPALAALTPTLGDNDVVILDVGANTECDMRNLFEFAVMGAAYARTILGLERPRVGLLNIGTEAQKGTDVIRDTAAALTNADNLALNFCGYVEGHKLSRGDFDVIVCDGFSGNIALKTLEGTARFVTDLLKRAFTSSIRSKFGFLISRPATELLRHHLDPNNHNGGVFLGLNGIVVKSHGSADAKGIANAIAVAARLVRADIARKIADDLANNSMKPAT